MTVDVCRSCQLLSDPSSTPGGVILETRLWRLTHAVEPVPLLGWLILQTLRHVEHVADLTSVEAKELGPLLQRVSAAISAEVRPAKVYVAMFAEARGFAHLHFHLIPRSAAVAEDRRGPRVFDYLRDGARTEENQAELGVVTALAEALRSRLNG